MIPRFQVKFCEKRPTVETLQSCTPIVKFFGLFVDMIAQILENRDIIYYLLNIVVLKIFL